MIAADPVGVGQVDADRRRGIAVAAQNGRRDHLGRNALHPLLAVLRVDRGMVLEPLRFLTDRLRPARGLLVAVIDHAFPCSPVAERVAVVLGEAVDEIDLRHGILDPADVESVELP